MKSQTTFIRSMWEKSNALQISFYGIDESEQKVFNNRSGIKMTLLYCMNYSDWFAFFISILTASIVGLLQNGYQPDWNQTIKSCIVKSLILWIRSRYKKSNAVQMSLYRKLSAIWKKITHWYCMSLHASDLITFICTSGPHPYWEFLQK